MDSDVDKIDLAELDNHIPGNLQGLFQKRDGAARFVQNLPKLYEPEKVGPKEGEAKTVEQRVWELIGLKYIMKERPQPYDALRIFAALYDHMLAAQVQHNGARVHKGMPLVWMCECFMLMGYPVHAKRYLMLTLCEDAIRGKGRITPDTSGVYFRLVWRHGLPDSELHRYSKVIYDMSCKFPMECLFPEYVLQDLDQDWMIEYPTLQESSAYFITSRYVDHLIAQLGNPSGKALERLAAYLLSCIPGCRATMRRRTKSTEYDIVCSLDGPNLDFRSEIGRYFVCECKDWRKPADFSTVAKFSRVLDSAKSRFGILFSTSGISGKGKAIYAEREQVKVFQDRGQVIIDVDLADLVRVANGVSFLSLMRDKYESVRLDLADTT